MNREEIEDAYEDYLEKYSGDSYEYLSFADFRKLYEECFEQKHHYYFITLHWSMNKEYETLKELFYKKHKTLADKLRIADFNKRNAEAWRYQFQ
jgi:hypothetical protein